MTHVHLIRAYYVAHCEVEEGRGNETPWQGEEVEFFAHNSQISMRSSTALQLLSWQIMVDGNFQCRNVSDTCAVLLSGCIPRNADSFPFRFQTICPGPSSGCERRGSTMIEIEPYKYNVSLGLTFTWFTQGILKLLGLP